MLIYSLTYSFSIPVASNCDLKLILVFKDGPCFGFDFVPGGSRPDACNNDDA